MSEHAPSPHVPTPLEQEAERLAAAAFMGTSPNPEQDMQTALDTRRMLNERPATAAEAAAAEDHYDKTMGPDQRDLDQKAKAADLVNQWAMADLRQDPTRAYEIREELERRSFKGLVTNRKTNETGLGPYADEFHGAANRMNALFDRKERIKGKVVENFNQNNPPAADNGETQEIPAIREKGGMLAPKIDMHDIGQDGLDFTKLIAKHNIDPESLTVPEQNEMNDLFHKLNGTYTPVDERLRDDPKGLEKEAKKLGLNTPFYVEQLRAFEEKQVETKARGMPTAFDKLPNTGQKLWDMFSAYNPKAALYVGEGGITPKMHELLTEQVRNKGADAPLWRIVEGKPEFTPHNTSARRGRKINRLAREINRERQVPTRWIFDVDKNGKPVELVGPDPKYENETKGAGDFLKEQFTGNRESSDSTRRKRFAAAMKGKLRKLPGFPKGPETSGGERERKAKLLGRTVAGDSVGVNILNAEGPAEEVTPEVEEQIVAMTPEQITGMTAEEARSAFPNEAAFNRFMLERATLGGSEFSADDDTTA